VPLAIVKDVLYDGLETIRSGLNNFPLTINSGYRNPRHNALLTNPPGRPESRHIYGDAADIDIADFNGDGLFNKKDWLILANKACDVGASYVEPYEWGHNHVHVDWGPVRGDATTNYCIGR